MYNYDTELVKQLDTILPTYYELFLDNSITTPCLTYLEISNVPDKEADTLRYSTISYRIKLWHKDGVEVDQYIKEMDKLLYSLGFKRVAYNILWTDDLCQRIFTYQALACENN